MYTAECDVCVVCCGVCVSTGGVLPVLAQPWLQDLWRVHSGATGRGETVGLCVEKPCHPQ